MRSKSSIISTIFFTLVLLVGLSVMLYPTISNWWNEKTQSRAVASYDSAVAELDDTRTDDMIAEANRYNEQIAELKAPFADYAEVPGYESILDVSGTGIIGYITIPVIDVELPIYHGVSDAVLNVAAGHLPGSALPIGGENTHAVISAHRGLPSAKLFSDLDQLVVGDTFTITVLNQIYTYEIEACLIVKPHEMEKLLVIPGGDYVTLMTCTPYGVNTHRLLLRAHRIETIYQSSVKVSADAVQVDPLLVVPLISAPLLMLLLLTWSVGGRKNKLLPYRTSLYLPIEYKKGD
ncbi:MAG: class C sortase [Ruminococcus sp.]|nr:class C sortase [Ruminococcus sp.]MBQ8906839.1 class C sortase [Ruminococcus sp.]